jgi:hypothetical protein
MIFEWQDIKICCTIPLIVKGLTQGLEPNRKNNVVVILIGRVTKSKFLSVTKNV